MEFWPALLLCTITFCVPAQALRICPKPGETEISYYGNGKTLPQVYQTLISCPEIKSLEIRIGRTGCVVEQERAFQFKFHEGDRFPPLEELSLNKYDLDDSRTINDEKFWRTYTTKFQIQQYLGNLVPWLAPGDVPPREVSNLEKWLQAMDWTHLRKLHLVEDGSLFYERMAEELPGLRELSLEWTASGTNLPRERTDFLRTIPSLESLSILISAPWRYTDDCDSDWKNRTRFPISEIMETHGPTLRNLSLHQGESHMNESRRLMLSVDEIEAIGASCPKLNHLGLDLDRDKTTGWPNATINALLQLSSITSLDIGLEIGADLHTYREWGEYGYNPDGLEGAGPWREPRMSLEVAEMLFSDFREKKTGEMLEEVVFTVGDWPNRGNDGPLYTPSWEEGRSRRFVCKSASPEGATNGSCKLSGNHDPYDFE